VLSAPPVHALDLFVFVRLQERYRPCHFFLKQLSPSAFLLSLLLDAFETALLQGGRVGFVYGAVGKIYCFSVALWGNIPELHTCSRGMFLASNQEKSLKEGAALKAPID
jgi:hypothetical protein